MFHNLFYNWTELLENFFCLLDKLSKQRTALVSMTYKETELWVN